MTKPVKLKRGDNEEPIPDPFLTESFAKCRKEGRLVRTLVSIRKQYNKTPEQLAGGIEVPVEIINSVETSLDSEVTDAMALSYLRGIWCS